MNKGCTLRMVFKMCILGCSLVVQRLGLGTFTAVGPGSVPGQGSKILQTTQPKKKKKKYILYTCEYLHTWRERQRERE